MAQYGTVISRSYAHANDMGWDAVGKLPHANGMGRDMVDIPPLPTVWDEMRSGNCPIPSGNRAIRWEFCELPPEPLLFRRCAARFSNSKILSREGREGGEVRRTGIFVEPAIRESSSVRSDIMVAARNGGRAQAPAPTGLKFILVLVLQICRT